MSDRPLVSVVVPVYNVERYVEQCVESLTGQTLVDIEVILVNDGSTDGSLRLLRAAEARDARVRVIDKPNGGYGAAVNRGLDVARGEYVAVAEPDDFVDAHMYEDLYNAALLADGTRADVVKGSYWNYFDLPDAVPYVEAPNLMNCMPKRSFCSTVSDEFEVLFHHPSIWSAIYRRDFLAERGIRMIEPRGAGWADNPWFFETLLQAKSFVWVPSAYYYYRQTNPDASSNLRDYHLPFDRLRDIRALFDRLRVRDRQVIACLYSRTFSYVGSVVGEFGFDERDPELRGLIREAFESMDPGILYGGHKGIRKEHLEYYELVMGTYGDSIREHAAVESPRASVVVPFGSERGELMATLSSLARQTCEPLEVLCVDCGCTDASREVAETFARRDRRFRLLDAGSSDRGDGIDAGLSAARSPVSIVLFPGVAPAAGHVARLADALEGGRAEVAVCGGFAGVAAGVSGGGPLLARIASSREFSLSACAFDSAFLREVRASAGKRLFGTGLALALGALCRSRHVAVAGGTVPPAIARGRLFGRRADPGDAALYRARMDALDDTEEMVRGLGEEAERALAQVAVRELLDCVRRFAGSRDGRDVFEDARLRAMERYGIARLPRSSFCDQEDFLSLELNLLSTYDDMLRRDVGRLRGSYWSLVGRCASLKGSSSYRIGNALVRATRKVIPSSLYRRLRH